MRKIPDPNKMRRFEGPKFSKEDLKDVKIRITTYIDKDLLGLLKQMAEKRGGKYQSLLNDVLRSSLTGEDSFEDLWGRVERLEQEEEKKKRYG